MATRQNVPETIREEGVNVHLAQLLRNRGISARAERRSREGVPDIRVDLKSVDLIILECKWDGSASLLQKPDRRTPDRFSRSSWHGWRFSTLAGSDRKRTRKLVLRPPRTSSGGSTDRVELRHRSDGYGQAPLPSLRTICVLFRWNWKEWTGWPPLPAQSAMRWNRQRHRLQSTLGYPDASPTLLPAPTRKRTALPPCASVVWCSSTLSPSKTVSPLPMKTYRLSAKTLARGIAGLHYAWREICDNIDYVPVFELAADILGVLGDGPDEVQAPVIGHLVKAMEDTRRLEGHDLSGRLFHTLLTDAKFTGAYYTSVPAATLLSRLVFHGWPLHVDWADHEFPASLNVADLACGTGTLLMAVAAEAERLHRDAGGLKSADFAQGDGRASITRL